MPIAIGSDHAGFPLKEVVRKYLEDNNLEYIDFGTYGLNRVDYPDYAIKVAEVVAEGRCVKGVVICGTGIGVSIVANKKRGVRAALCCSEYMAEMARKHNNANVLAMGGRTTSRETAIHILQIFLSTDFAGGRHDTRVKKIHSLTNK